ncbi:MAG: hypothetical protein KDA05_04450 [Phycisphaerales bacterium]|nr:hypothetical protein [Phycisphaerales bacterium]
MRSTVPIALALAGLALAGAPATAQSYTIDIDDVHITLIDATGAAHRLDLGDIEATVANRSGAGMSATFRVAREHRPGGPNSHIWDHIDIHWVNLIRDDDCPASVRGIPAGRPDLPFPLIDMPRHGWDYVYRYTRGRRGRGPERIESNADGRTMRDDARDDLPWYHTTEEEAMLPGSGNENAGFGAFRTGVNYSIRDLPTLCGNGGTTAFTALLVAVVPPDAEGGVIIEDGLTLQHGQLLVLAGFDWDWSTRDLRLAPTAFTADQLNTALANSDFPEWQAAVGTPVFVNAVLDPSFRSAPVEPEDSTPAPLGRKLRPGA